MPSVADRKAAKRAKALARGADALALRHAEAGGAAPAAEAAAPEKPPVRVRRQTGLEFLSGRGRIDARQLAAGDRYGRAFRRSIELTGPALKSSLAEPERIGGAATGGLPAGMDYAQEREVLAARAELQRVRFVVLQNHSGLVAVLDAICGKELSPGEVTPIQREQEEIATGLRIALDLVAAFYAALDKST